MFRRINRNLSFLNSSFKTIQLQRFSSNSWAGSKGPKVAVVLSGSGVYDGSEIHETVSVFIHLSRKAQIHCFAPNKAQFHVVNHLNGQVESNESRQVLVEAARIARGNVSPLNELNVANFDAVVFPGGFGAAKNLSNFAFEGANFSVDPQVTSVLNSFHQNKKPIALCCIAPVLAAKSIKGCQVTIGNDIGVSQIIESVGSKHVNAAVTEAIVDTENKIVTSPAYMDANAPLCDIHDGIGSMIDKLIDLISNK
eukprot:TRINITY_DN364_c0_g3_i2.p1 TRINITY_DN364_c0_g3~~TRINITY_DN364_c0_g3_i2.p1  ORF type:complete len:253 (+),score=104.03 TRINITY_DN364_c0_g3_i2:757-1515(+)